MTAEYRWEPLTHHIGDSREGWALHWIVKGKPRRTHGYLLSTEGQMLVLDKFGRTLTDLNNMPVAEMQAVAKTILLSLKETS